MPPDLADLFLEMRREFSYDLEPDYRAEAFGEWVEAHEAEVTAWQAQRYEQPPEYYEREYARWLADTRAEVPF